MVTYLIGFAKDLECKKSKFVAWVNHVITEFGFAHPRGKVKMVKTYGSCCLWDLFGSDCQKLSTTVHNMTIAMD